MVLEGYPLGFPLGCLQKYSLIETASCLIVRPSKEETHKVLVTVLGDPHTEVHLGIFITFNLREYYPEPTRCGKCQRFGHYVSKGRSMATCSACSELHLTDLCTIKIREGKPITAKCPICGATHHAWNPICPERLRHVALLYGEVLPTEQWTPRVFKRKLHEWNSSSQADTPSSSRIPYSSVTKSIKDPSTKQHPSPATIPLSSHKCSSCGNTIDSQDVDHDPTDLASHLSAKATDRNHIQEAIENILAGKPAITVGPSNSAPKSANNENSTHSPEESPCSS